MFRLFLLIVFLFKMPHLDEKANRNDENAYPLPSSRGRGDFANVSKSPTTS